MVKINIVKEKGMITTFQFSGHAMYRPGNDIVCSAVSTIFYTMLATLSNFKKHFMIYEEIGKRPYIKIIKGFQRKDIQAVLICGEVGLCMIQKKYPFNVRVNVEEY